ncbi:MAG: dUTP diphosphatase [Candidatus Margulisbacteria bacterium]|nr:dUTP diphosphatase [Candidatus Margulisiibacteriota bacterium]
MLNNVTIQVELLEHFSGLKLPEYKTILSSGLDLASAEDTIMHKGEKKLVATGIKIAIPAGYEGQIRPRSGLSLKEGIIIPNTPGTIDADYRGEVKIILWNLGEKDFTINKGDRIAQLVIVPVVRAEFEVVGSLDITARNDGGFGHTGK